MERPGDLASKIPGLDKPNHDRAKSPNFVNGFQLACGQINGRRWWSLKAGCLLSQNQGLLWASGASSLRGATANGRHYRARSNSKWDQPNFHGLR
jgi:hypothetical protein